MGQGLGAGLGQHPITSWAGADAGPVSQPLPNSTNLQKTEINQSLLYRGPVDPANWFGVRKGFPNLGYIQVRAGPRWRAGGAEGTGAFGGWRQDRGPHCPLPQNHLQILLLLVFEAIVYRRQEHHRRQHQQAPLPAQAVCVEGTRQLLDRDLLSCVKYFINFFFYKFGLEVSLPSPAEVCAAPGGGALVEPLPCAGTQGPPGGTGGGPPRVLCSPGQGWPVG